MRICLYDGLDRIEIGDRIEFASGEGVQDTGRPIPLREAWEVQQFIRQHFSRAADRHRLRGVLATRLSFVHRIDDNEVLRQLSGMFQHGLLLAYRFVGVQARIPRVRSSGASSEIIASQSTTSPRSLLQEPATPEPLILTSEPQAKDNAIFEQDYEAAQAEEASLHATPFYEICQFQAT